VRRERARPVRLHKHVRSLHQVLQRFFLISQIDAGRTLADSGVEIHQPGIGQVRRADLQHFGAVLGEALGASRSGKHAGEVESPHAAERTLRRSELFYRGICNPLDRQERLRRDCPRLRVLTPRRMAAHISRAAAGGVDRLFERSAVPGATRFFRAGALVRCAEHAHRRFAVIWEIAVDADPAVANRVEPAQGIPDRRCLAVHAQVSRASQRDGSGAGAYTNLLS
jgi:hypothetical protein